ncbi:DNA primase [Aurantiacibacter gangjinensis]|uniref:DNA primase n=1 Tax=Aurantiacibacter gangjinensis TaxID=502682 RepID=A0A0G9MQ21_9SPHN|nr:DNA primase [Aurantiacibacter gangjinensis]APE28660.1 DNA primase [Aurantiacibacter gangjinensis]KLE32831.1 DNA primase [Aurantiacibacter gangjinensis]
MALSPEWLDQLKSRITLSALIQRTVKLTRAGREWKACCPFHSEKTPSFYVNDQKGFYHCFGCQQHGGAIDWMMEQHGLEFMDAVKELAAEAGMDVPAPDPRSAQRAEKRAGLHDVMAAAQEWFVRNLSSDGGAEARGYLERRGLDAHTIRRFGFGWAPDDKQAITKALSQFDERLLIEAGLLIEVENKLPYARFRGRVMLPIQDARERVTAFGGRILQDRDGVAKYLNSPDTPLFDKGRTLYNIHRAAAASRKTRRVVVAEGYMDVIAMAVAGIEDAVAPMGTALTEGQIELLWRMADKPVLCFDGDKAGTRAAMRAAERALPLLRPGHSLQVVQLPGGMDPDDLIKKDGPQAMAKLLDAPKPLLDLVWEHERDAGPLTSPEDKAGLKARLLEHADAIQHPDIRSLYRREWLDRYGNFAFPPRPKRDFKPGSRFKPDAPQRTSPEVVAALRKASGGHVMRDMLTTSVLHGLARHPGEIHRHADALLGLAAADASLAQAVDFLLDRAESLEAPGVSPISSSDNLPPPPDKARFSFLMEGSDPGAAREDLAEAVSLLVERPALEVAIAAATRRFDSDPEGAFAEQQRLRKRKLEIDSRLGQMARKRAASQADEDQDTASVDGQAAEQETD